MGQQRGAAAARTADGPVWGGRRCGRGGWPARQARGLLTSWENNGCWCLLSLQHPNLPAQFLSQLPSLLRAPARRVGAGAGCSHRRMPRAGGQGAVALHPAGLARQPRPAAGPARLGCVLLLPLHFPPPPLAGIGCSLCAPARFPLAPLPSACCSPHCLPMQRRTPGPRPRPPSSAAS